MKDVSRSFKRVTVVLGALLGLALTISQAPASAQATAGGVAPEVTVHEAANSIAPQWARLWKFTNRESWIIWDAADSADALKLACNQLGVVPGPVCDLIPIAAIPIQALGKPDSNCLAVYGQLWPPVVLPVYEPC